VHGSNGGILGDGRDKEIAKTFKVGTSASTSQTRSH
jgi:hypothetical protein